MIISAILVQLRIVKETDHSEKKSNSTISWGFSSANLICLFH